GVDGYFSLHVILTGSGTGKFEYLCSNDPGTANASGNFVVPTVVGGSTAADIVTSHTVTSGPSSDGIALYEFLPVTCRYMKIRMSETGIANSITVTAWLGVQ
ncbi:hypothetical protein LCGC14_2732650, partial [marine sediment metagenome]